MKIPRSALIGALLGTLLLSACQQKQPAPVSPAGTPATTPSAATQPAGKGKLYSLNMEDCAGYTAADAAEILEVSANELKTDISQLYEEGPWVCAFVVPGHEVTKAVSFNVTVSESVEDATIEMEQYMSHLETAYQVLPGQEGEGAYSEISGPGIDQSVWTDVNKTFTARKGNVTIQVITPNDKMLQIKVAEAFFAKF